ncbi:MAG TPA: threonine/serine dehydratase [Gemmatimonadaceae bacterium]|nr:threonine/serine dehydratase [Gemmatimonadaceae bacterium]
MARDATTFAELQAADVLAAAHRLRGVVTRTTLRRSDKLSAHVRADVYLKLETEQLTGSYKVRGAFNSIASLDERARAKGVVASSAGNHGLGVAWAAHHFGIPALIFIPDNAPEVKRRGIEAMGARVDRSAPHYDAAMAAAKAHGEQHGLKFINPCLDNAVIAGQGTVALEILEDLPDAKTLVLSVGGAGLLAGTASLIRRIAPEVTILGAQSVATAAMSKSLAAGRVVHIESEKTLADGLAGDIDEFALDVGRNGLDQIVTVEESDLADAIAWLYHEENLTVEGAGAAGVAALLTRKLKPDGPVAVVVTGGNIDRERLEEVLTTRAKRAAGSGQRQRAS